ncbi:MAG: LysR family transcriptional regulator [Sphingomonadaceae bacterium]|nr:LysR family transcriptional regulator [Sphingomonadaceae bacterium]
MNSVRLQRFLAVYDHRSFGRAAVELHVTQPALSKSIQLLEDELKVKLFERTASGVVPTVYGEALSLHAKAIEAEMRNAVREIATLSGAVLGDVTIGVTPSVAAELIPRAFFKMRAQRPGITLTVHEGLMEQHIPALRRGELDMIVGGWIRGSHPDLTVEGLVRDRAFVVAGPNHDLAGAGPVTLAALLMHQWVLPPHSQFWLHSFENAFLSTGMQPPTPAAVANSPGFLLAAVQTGDYLTVLPEALVAREVSAGGVVLIDAPDLALGIDITVTYRTSVVHMTAFDAFLRLLKELCGWRFRRNGSVLEAPFARDGE